jgi:hypothetical protein
VKSKYTVSVLFFLLLNIFSCGEGDAGEEKTLTFPFTDNITGYMWSTKAEEIDWKNAVEYCYDLNEGGFSDWRLPTISELRTLIQNCPATETGGECGVTDSCLSYSECKSNKCFGCDRDETGIYSVFRDTGIFLSQTPIEGSHNEDYRWHINFFRGTVDFLHKLISGNIRCVR